MKSEMNQNNEILDEIDLALREDRSSKSEQDNCTQKAVDRSGKLARLLRSVGALVVVAAAVSFLVQKWGIFDHLTRYFSFLIFTASLGGLGLFCSLKLNENKSARTFLALGGALVVVNFAQLGALIYSVFLGNPDFHKYPGFLLWQAPSIEALLITMSVGIPVLALLTAASFSALAREVRKNLLLGSLGLNMALLIPIRDPAFTGVLTLTMVIYLGYIYRNVSYTPVAKTFEGRIALSLLLLPLAMVIGRGTYLYDASNTLFGLLALSASVVLFYILPQLFEDNKTRLLLQRLSILCNAVASYCIFSDIIETFSLPQEIAVPLISTPFIASLIAMPVAGKTDGKFEFSLSAVTGVIAILLQVLLFPGIFTFTFALSASIFIMSYGFLIKERTFFYSGVAGAAISLINHLKYAYEIAAINPWISLAMLGTVTIVAAAYAEKNLPKLLTRFSQDKFSV